MQLQNLAVIHPKTLAFNVNLLIVHRHNSNTYAGLFCLCVYVAEISKLNLILEQGVLSMCHQRSSITQEIPHLIRKIITSTECFFSTIKEKRYGATKGKKNHKYVFFTL